MSSSTQVTRQNYPSKSSDKSDTLLVVDRNPSDISTEFISLGFFEDEILSTTGSSSSSVNLPIVKVISDHLVDDLVESYCLGGGIVFLASPDGFNLS